MKTLLLLIVLFSFSSVKAQDTIFYRNNTHELARIIKVDRTTISFKNYLDTLDNSIYHKSNITVSHVVLANGERHNLVYTKSPSETIPELPDLYPNFISLNAFDLITGQLTFNFQHSFKNNKYLTIGVPLSVSFNTLAGTLGNEYYIGTSNYYNRYKVFSSGIELMFFPVSGVNDGYMIGTALDFGLTRYNIPLANDAITTKDGEFYGIYLHTGYFLNKIKHFGLAFYGDVGVSRRSQYNYYYYDPYYPYSNNQLNKYYSTAIAFKLSIQVGYTF